MAPNDSSNLSQRGTSQVAPPTNAQLMEVISQLQEQIDQAQSNQRPTTVKLPKPDFFYSERTNLRTFLTQMDMQLRIINCIEEAEKVIYASTYLHGQEFEWFEPYIREFNEKPHKDWGPVEHLELC